MSIKPYPSNTHEFDFSNLDFSNHTGIIEHPQDWIIYTHLNNYTLCIDYLCIQTGCMIYRLSRYNILSSTDNIIFNISDDKMICELITDKYKYKFKKTDKEREISNNLGGIYKTHEIELIFLEKLNHKNNISEKMYIDFEENIIDFYMNGKYCWSKIIATNYTKGIYFICLDKIFTVIQNGAGILDVFNLDGTLYKKIQTSMEYIRYANIIFNDKNENPKYLKLVGFIWNPIEVVQYIDVNTLLNDKLRQKTYWEDNFNEIDECVDINDPEIDKILEYDE